MTACVGAAQVAHVEAHRPKSGWSGLAVTRFAKELEDYDQYVMGVYTFGNNVWVA